MNRNALLLSAALVLFPTLGSAADTAQVKLLHRTVAGSTAVLDLDQEKASKWIREVIVPAQNRLASELPAALGVEGCDIEMVSIPHPEYTKAENKFFVQWTKETNPATFIPFVKHVATEKMDVYVALEARVSIPGKEAMIFPVVTKRHVEYGHGFLSVSNFMDALKGASNGLMGEAVEAIVASARASAGAQNSSKVENPAGPLEQ